MPEATLTNAITNALHASFLLAYLIGATRAKIPRVVKGLFFLLFILKLMGVYVHYAPYSPSSARVWAIIAVSTVAMNFIVMREARVGWKVCFGVIAICIAATGIFLTGVGDFSYIALPTALVFGVAAYHAHPGSKLRLGLVMVVISNLVWIAARKIGQGIAGGEVPVDYRYDNDLYHFLLIASTFVIYQGFLERRRAKTL
ncbi:MAG: hypothetical protein ACI8XO_000724 [Verrucomicrobiales bacterium]|jgi:hypothetical protein